LARLQSSDLPNDEYVASLLKDGICAVPVTENGEAAVERALYSYKVWDTQVREAWKLGQTIITQTPVDCKRMLRFSSEAGMKAEKECAYLLKEARAILDAEALDACHVLSIAGFENYSHKKTSGKNLQCYRYIEALTT
jgi:hypothetical protein